jgi:hypothetical protein
MRRPSGKLLHLVRYEDLTDNPLQGLLEISRTFGWNLGREALAEAVLLSDVDVMKVQEEHYRQFNPRHRATFVRAGNRPLVDSSLEKKIKEMCLEERALLGYE